MLSKTSKKRLTTEQLQEVYRLYDIEQKLMSEGLGFQNGNAGKRWYELRGDIDKEVKRYWENYFRRWLVETEFVGQACKVNHSPEYQYLKVAKMGTITCSCPVCSQYLGRKMTTPYSDKEMEAELLRNLKAARKAASP